jgi:hypothetical protein
MKSVFPFEPVGRREAEKIDKLQHWRTSQAESVTNTAPILEFGFLLPVNPLL